VIAVVGARGQLGTAFVGLLGKEAIALTRDQMDVTDQAAVQAVLTDLRPEAIINCSAYTAVDRAEDEPEQARSVNADAVRYLARVAAELSVPFLTYSTDYVFDGTASEPYVESDPTDPINVYGETKRAGERYAAAVYPESLIVRTSWVLSGTHPNFASTMVRLARQGPVRVVDDQRGRPTLVDDLAVASLDALRSGATGVLHCANGPTVTWFDLARDCVEAAGLDPDAIEPCATADFPTRAARPVNSALGSERLRALGLDPLPSYRVGLPAMVRRLMVDVLDVR
jgi:dTDP-4-dehydrorhamnose reductase